MNEAELSGSKHRWLSRKANYSKPYKGDAVDQGFGSLKFLLDILVQGLQTDFEGVQIRSKPGSAHERKKNRTLSFTMHA